ncbi:unnamed protein product [Protopolystoma xenopodis]|uniref:Uncharacterized protein n=1 Tax=Protopolystoma xenopodis TaxID=117903 RepID=A0A3S5C0G8_9PLAT|nr:unnamed protein product [Protopolystoma xenopodis]
MVATRLRTSPMVQSPGRAPGGQIERPASVQILSETKDGIDETSEWRQARRDGLGKKISDNDENKFERENKKRKAVNEINLEKEKNKGSKEEHKEECSNKHVRNILRKRSVCNGSKMEEEETIPSLTKNSSFPSFVSRIFHSLHTDHHSHATQPIGPEPLTHTTCGEHLRLAIPPAISSRQSLKSPVGPITSRHPCPGRSRSDGAELPPAPTNLSTPKPGEGPPPHAPPHAPPPMMHSRMSSILAPSTLLSSFRQAPSVDLLDSMSNRSFELDIL